MAGVPTEGDAWVKPLGEMVLGLNRSGEICRGFGGFDLVEHLAAHEVIGLTWSQFVTRYADEKARSGLLAGWQAMTEGRVARRYWPNSLPFGLRLVARLRTVDGDPDVAVVAQIRPDTAGRLNALLEDSSLVMFDRLSRLSRQLLSGIAGPLTDAQVNDLRVLVQNLTRAQMFVEELRAELFSPAVIAPLPHHIATLFSFSERDFSARRIHTHRLRVAGDWPDVQVYCYGGVREAVRRLVHTLLLNITEETGIWFRNELGEDGDTVQVSILYQSQNPILTLEQRVEPLGLESVDQFETGHVVERLISGIQAWLSPVRGQVWAEPCSEDGFTGCVVLVVPWWKPASHP